MQPDKELRQKQITKTSVIGIVTNIVLVIFKMLVGLISGSIAIVLDAVNNLTDAVSSVVTIAGIKLAKIPPNKDHPYGHGRVEYFSAIIIAGIVITTGVTSLIESVEKVIHPEKPSYTLATILVIAASIAVKLLLGRFTKKQGEKYNSTALIGSGSDATFDAIISASTLVAAGVMLLTGFSIDGIVGALISLFIIKAGIEMFMEPINSVLGSRAESEITKDIKADVRSMEGVMGAYDLVLNNYGPEYAIGSVHVEVDDQMSARQIHQLEMHIRNFIFEKYNVLLSVSIYAVDNTEGETGVMQREIKMIARNYAGVIQAHGVYIDQEEQYISFDVVMDFSVKDRAALASEIASTVEEKYPGYTVKVNIDLDFSD